jgi:DNA-binding Lrp family transcriptional regulator
MSPETLPTEHTEETNARILAVSEDQVKGFMRQPFQFIAEQSGVPFDTVVERIRAMLKAGVIRRVRQTLLANKLAEGALVAWKLPVDKLEPAFEFLFKQDPFSGHVVLRSTDREVSGSDFRLWTTLKVPQGRSIEQHCDVLKRLIGAEDYYTMQAHGIFALGVGHVRRKTMEPGEKADEPAVMMTTNLAELDDEEWHVLLHLKGDLSLDEIGPEPWAGRAKAAGVSLEKFCEIAKRLDEKGVIGRFSTFLEHVKPSAAGVRVTRFNALFHWKVPKGMEERGGAEVGRHPDHDPLLLARGRRTLRQRQHHGRHPRHRQGDRARPQGRHRPPPGKRRHPARVHERLLGRSQRDQAERDQPDRLQRVARQVGQRVRPGDLSPPPAWPAPAVASCCSAAAVASAAS